MGDPKLLEILEKVSGTVFGFKNPFTPEQFMQKFAFDVRLPKQTTDSTTGETTWAQSLAASKYMTIDNIRKKSGETDWIMPKKAINELHDILAAWQENNFMATERKIESINVHESDNVYFSDTVYRSQDIQRSKNIAFCDSIQDSEYVTASQRSGNINFCIRVEDSNTCSNSFGLIWCNKVSNSLFLQDCYDMFECMFCSHMSGRKFCIANMQFEEEEYFKIKKMVVEWVLTSQ